MQAKGTAWSLHLHHLNTDTMDELFVEMYDLLLYRATSIVGNEEDAKDIVQDLYVLISSQGLRQEAISNRRGYLYGMVSNMAKMFVRNERNHAKLELETANTDIRIGLDAPFMVDEMLWPLTELQKAIVRLHDIEGYSCKEIAGHLDRTKVAVKKQLALAHRKLRETHSY